MARLCIILCASCPMGRNFDAIWGISKTSYTVAIHTVMHASPSPPVISITLVIPSSLILPSFGKLILCHASYPMGYDPRYNTRNSQNINQPDHPCIIISLMVMLQDLWSMPPIQTLRKENNLDDLVLGQGKPG